uniref:DUF2834 domain-containing protein n=1 Tax=Fulvivirga sp. TaxID=1931237 RepID=UPI00404B5DA3
MKKAYLFLAIIGFILPTILVLIESVETGNVLLYLNPVATIEGMFANRISTIFMIDLLFSVMVFLIWSYSSRGAMSMKTLYMVWLLTFLLGLAGGFPLFLYLKEKSQ